jgi:hypothetical protein
MARGKTAGTTDYAIIEDFDASDQIQLFGSRHEYTSATNSCTFYGFSGLGIYHDSNGMEC